MDNALAAHVRRTVIGMALAATLAAVAVFTAAMSAAVPAAAAEELVATSAVSAETPATPVATDVTAPATVAATSDAVPAASNPVWVETTYKTVIVPVTKTREETYVINEAHTEYVRVTHYYAMGCESQFGSLGALFTYLHAFGIMNYGFIDEYERVDYPATYGTRTVEYTDYEEQAIVDVPGHWKYTASQASKGSFLAYGGQTIATDTLYGQTALDTNAAVVEDAFPTGCGTVIVATSSGYWDALSGSALGCNGNATPLLIVNGTTDSLDTSAASFLKKRHADIAAIDYLGDSSVVSDEKKAQFRDLLDAWGIVYKSTDGTTLQTTEATEKSDCSYKGAALTKAPVGTRYTYTFAGWTPDAANPATSDATYTATFTEHDAYVENGPYTVTFENYDGTVLQTGTYGYGEEVAYVNQTATFKDAASGESYTIAYQPQRDDGSYKFSGWDREVSACAGNAVYTAQFEQVLMPASKYTYRDYETADAVESYINEHATGTDLSPLGSTFKTSEEYGKIYTTISNRGRFVLGDEGYWPNDRLASCNACSVTRIMADDAIYYFVTRIS